MNVRKQHVHAALAVGSTQFVPGPLAERLDVVQPVTPVLTAWERKHRLEEALHSASPAQSLLPGAQYIGCGYDVFGGYAAASSVMAPMIETTAFTTFGGFAVPSHVFADAIGETIVSTHEYTSTSEYSSHLGLRADVEGQYAFFKGALNADFTREQQASSLSRFADRREQIRLWSVRLQEPELRSLLKEGVRRLIDEGDADQLFQMYGGHMLIGAIIGGESRYVACLNEAKASRKLSLKAAVELAFQIFVRASASADHEKIVSELESASTMTLTTTGGNPMLGGSAIVDGASYKIWRQSVDQRADPACEPVMVDFAPQGLFEIWRLASSTTRRQYLREKWEHRAAGVQLPKTVHPEAVYQVTTRTSGNVWAGTNSRITAQLIGLLGRSPVFELSGSHERRDVETTTYTTTELGEILAVLLSNRARGSSPDWRVDRVTVQNNSLDRTWQTCDSRVIEGNSSAEVRLTRVG